MRFLLNLDYYTLFLQELRTDMKQNYTNILIAGGLILMAATARIVNAEMHLYNFAPVAALGLFSGAVIKDKRYAFLFTLLAQLISDTYIQLFTAHKGFYGIDQFFVYGGMLLVTLLGTKMGQIRTSKVLGYSLLGTTIFFIVSNFGVWVSIELGQDLYGYGTGVKGLTTTYLMALPFYTKVGTQLFVNSFAGDLLFSSVLFGGYYLLQQAVSNKMIKTKS